MGLPMYRTAAGFSSPVSTMSALGILKGRTEERFAPNAPITRAEFAAICARFDTGVSDGCSEFTDLAGHWAREEIGKAASLGWIQGYEDGTFRPDQSITRAEAMTMINRVLNPSSRRQGGLAARHASVAGQPGPRGLVLSGGAGGHQ